MLVSAIMPTCDRRDLISVAIACYKAQDWPEKELVVLDDGKDAVGDLFADIPGVNYIRHEGKLGIGAKRNMCCEAARGKVIVHFDDDDWSDPSRIRDQVFRLLLSGKQMTGYSAIVFWSVPLGKGFLYEGSSNYAVGASMCYRRSFWEQNKFPEVNYAEDNALVFKARDTRQLEAVDGRTMLVARAHNKSTSAVSRVGQNSWPEVKREQIPEGFFQAIGCA